MWGFLAAADRNKKNYKKKGSSFQTVSALFRVRHSYYLPVNPFNSFKINLHDTVFLYEELEQ